MKLKKTLVPRIFLCIFLLLQDVKATPNGNPSNSPIEKVSIYGYNATLVMASVVNATMAQVAFTSFECSDKGYWSYSGASQGSAGDPGRAGKYYYNLSSGNITRSGMPSGTYIVSYWANGAATISGTNYVTVKNTTGPTINGWTYYQTTFGLTQANSTLTLSGSVKIDELRLHPQQAEMVSYTYDPLVGVTSETDINNNSTFYEYDEFNRLKVVRDNNGFVRKTYTYGLKNN